MAFQHGYVLRLPERRLTTPVSAYPAKDLPLEAKKILFLMTSTGSAGNNALWGGELFAREFLCQISKLGWEVTLVCPPSNLLLNDSELRKAVSRCVVLDISSGIRRPIKSTWVLFQWLKIAKDNWDHLFYGNGFQTLKWLAFGAFILRIRTVCHLHESSYEHYNSMRARLLSPCISHFIAISQSVRDLFVQGSGISPEKISVVHNGIKVDTDVTKSKSERDSVLREFGAPAAGYLVMMAARTDPLKGHEVFFRAAAEVLKSRSDVRFLVAGFEPGEGSQSKLHADLLALVYALGIEKDVTLIGYTEKVRTLMRCSDVVVVPSTSEGFGRTAIEAMAEKAALIVSRVGGLKEIVHQDIDGLFFENLDYADLSQKILYLINNQEVRERISTQAYLAAREYYSIPTMTGKIQKLLELVSAE